MTNPSTRVVVTDANVLINLIHVARLGLCADLPGLEFVVPDHVREEIMLPEQRTAFDQAAIGLSRLDRWLGIHMARNRTLGSSIFKREDSIPIQQWFTIHPKVLRDLYCHVLAGGSAEGMSELRWNLYVRCCCCHESPEIGQLILRMASEAADDEFARSLFSEACGVAWRNEGDHLLFEEIWRLAQDQPRFTESLERSRSCHLPRLSEWTAQVHRRESAAREEMKRDKVQSSRWLHSNLKILANGEARGALEKLSISYYNLRREEDLEQHAPLQRLAHLWGDEVNDAALQGFIQLALRSGHHDLRKSGRLAANNKISNWIFPVHAGIEILWKRQPAIIRELPERVLATAVVCHLRGLFSNEYKPVGWLEFAIENHSEACAEALVEFWTPAFELKKEHVKGLDRLTDWPTIRKRHSHKDLWTAIGDQLILKYTRDPASEGFGIYCVLWFGDEMKAPSPPAGIAAPQNATELTVALGRTIPQGHEHQIKVVCIDVSRPSS